MKLKKEIKKLEISLFIKSEISYYLYLSYCKKQPIRWGLNEKLLYIQFILKINS
jgi:hypothetical protein